MSKPSGDKTEDPTPKRKRDARKEGRIPRSAELGSWTAMFVATYLLQLTMASGAGRMRALLIDAGDLMASPEPEPGPAIGLLGDGLVSGIIVVAPLAFGLMALGILMNLLQVGWAPSGKLLKPKVERINPFKGFKRLFSPHSAWEAGKTLAKAMILGFLAYRSIMDIVPVLVAGGQQPVVTTMALVGSRALGLARNVALAGLVLALVDYGLQRRRTAKGMKMTKQEVRDEQRQQDGDPHMRGAMRSRQLSMSRNRMMSEVGTADVVLVNPTHVAVALKYDATSGAPRVVAKGAGEVAARIRAAAEEARVPMVEDIPLARAVFKACDLNQAIPAELYDAVARVLAFIYALRRRGSASGTHRLPAPTLALGA
ncbi:MAG: EscU/YscU/HrcU family type III secretion system export apparatus switch protein [Acidimicrobiales bacterium]